MKFVSLFAGVGGFDLAFERAGMECVAQVEIDAKCREVLAKHWPEVPQFEDVHDVTAKDIYEVRLRNRGRESGTVNKLGVPQQQPSSPSGVDFGAIGGLGGAGSVDVLCGGFPCQDYSVAGKRGGLAGDRGALWWQFHRLIAECRPRWVVGENVPGLLSSNGGRDFGAIVGSLVELGYGVVWRVLDAQYFGVAQRRRRVFIVGHSGGIPRPEILAFAEGCTGDTPPSRVAGQAAAPTLAARINGGGGLRTDHDLDGGLIAFNWQSGQDQVSARESHIDALHVGQTPAIAFAQNARNEIRDLDDLAGALQQPGMNQTTYLAYNPHRTLQPDGSVVSGWGERPVVDALHSPTGNKEPLVVAPSVRRLTPLECERLQGFPDNWTASQSDTQRYRQMGNAVAVPVAEWLGRRLVAA